MIESSNLTHTSENINIDNVVKYFQENEAIFTAIMTKIINGIKENKKEFITLFQESIEPGKAKIEEISTGKGKQNLKKKKQKKKTKNKKTQKGGASRHSANHRLKPI